MKDNNNNLNFNNQMEICQEQISNKINHIHKNWTIGILVVIVLILIGVILTGDFFDKKNVSFIVSITATCLSIVLSLLAIIYSTLYNIESSGNLSEIRSAVSEIKATEEAIKNSMQNLNLGVDNMKDNMSKVSNQLASRMADAADTKNNNYQVEANQTDLQTAGNPNS